MLISILDLTFPQWKLWLDRCGSNLRRYSFSPLVASDLCGPCCVPLGHWHHVALCFTCGCIYLYENKPPPICMTWHFENSNNTAIISHNHYQRTDRTFGWMKLRRFFFSIGIRHIAHLHWLMFTHTVLVHIILAVKFWLKFILSFIVWPEEQERKRKENKGSGI